jgi:hypothetical protein
MYKSEITAVFLAAILFTGALTAAIPSLTVDAEAETSTDQREIKDKEGKGESQEQVTANDQKLNAMKLYFTSQDIYTDSDTSSVKDNYGYAAGSEASSDKQKDSDSDSDTSSDGKKDSDSDSDTSSDEKKDSDSDSEASSDEKKDSDSDTSSVKDNYGYAAGSDTSSDGKKDSDSDSDTSSDEKKDSDSDSDTSSDEKKDSDSDTSSVKDNYGYAAGSEASSDEKKDSDSDTSSVKDNYGYAAGSEASSDEKGYYSGSSSYGQVFTKPSSSTDYGNDYDKKILKKIIVVCPDGSKLPFNGNNGIVTGGLNDGENRFIDNVLEQVCPAIDSCEECFDWLLNFADNRTEAVAIVNTVIETLNEQNSIDQPDLLPLDFRANGYEGSNLWEISKFFNGLLEDRTNQGQAISALISTIQESVDTKEVTPIVGSLAIDVIECIAKLEGIGIPLTPTNGNNNPNQAPAIPLTSVSSGTVR